MRIIYIFIIAFTFYSCKKEGVKPEKNQKDKILKSEKSFFEYSVFFFDTVYKNKTYKGYIDYKSDFDTIKSKQGDRRFTLYYAKSTDILISKYSKFKEQALDTFGSKNNNTIPIKFKFTEIGINYVDGFLEDEILIPVKNDSTKVRVLTQDARITFKVIVIDSVEESLKTSKPHLVENLKPDYL